MKTQKLNFSTVLCLLVVALAMSFAITAHAGGDSGGGGKGIVCPNNAKGKRVELLDLWEARQIHGLSLAPLTGDINKDLDAAIDRLKNIISEEDSKRKDGTIYKAADQTKKDLKWVAESFVNPSVNFANIQRFHGVELKETNDAFEEMKPSDPACEIKQIVRYVHNASSDDWQVNMDYVDQMDEANLIALALHESLYDILYHAGEEANSLRIRRAVGRAMAGERFLSIEEQLTKPYVKCSVRNREAKFQAALDKVKGDANKFFYAIAIDRQLAGNVYFTQDPKVLSASLKVIVDRVMDVRLMDFNNNVNWNSGVDLNQTAPKFFDAISKKDAEFFVNLSGHKEDIEFKTVVEFSLRSGRGFMTVTEATGSTPYHDVLVDMSCKLVK